MSIDVKTITNSFLKKDIKVIVIDNVEVLFIGNEVASCVGFTKKPRNAIETYIDAEDKTTLKEIISVRPELGRTKFFQNIHPNTTLINEYAFYNICLRSTDENIKPFRRWVYDMIASIRKENIIPTLELSFNNPVEMIRRILIPQIPKYDKSSKNLERKAICKALKEAYDSAKNPPNVRSGKKGGLKTQKDIQELKDSFYELKRKVNKYIEKYEAELEIALEVISSSSERRSSSNSE